MPVFDGMAAAGGCLYLAATDGKVICFGSSGQALRRRADVTLKASEFASTPRGGFTPTASHPDFAQLSQVRIASSDLGWRLTAASGQVGFCAEEAPRPADQAGHLQVPAAPGPQG